MRDTECDSIFNVELVLFIFGIFYFYFIIPQVVPFWVVNDIWWRAHCSVIIGPLVGMY